MRRARPATRDRCARPRPGRQRRRACVGRRPRRLSSTTPSGTTRHPRPSDTFTFTPRGPRYWSVLAARPDAGADVDLSVSTATLPARELLAELRPSRAAPRTSWRSTPTPWTSQTYYPEVTAVSPAASGYTVRGRAGHEHPDRGGHAGTLGRSSRSGSGTSPSRPGSHAALRRRPASRPGRQAWRWLEAAGSVVSRARTPSAARTPRRASPAFVEMTPSTDRLGRASCCSNDSLVSRDRPRCTPTPPRRLEDRFILGGGASTETTSSDASGLRLPGRRHPDRCQRVPDQQSMAPSTTNPWSRLTARSRIWPQSTSRTPYGHQDRSGRALPQPGRHVVDARLHHRSSTPRSSSPG